MKSLVIGTIALPACAFIAATLLIGSAEAAPLDLYDDLTDGKLYDGVMDFLGTIASGEDSNPRQAREENALRCRLPARKGVCRALIPRWSYDPEAKECKEFKFGGCDGNGNNFLTYKQCMKACEGF